MKDVFAIQDDIAHSIVKALQVTLTPQERRAMQSVATTDPEAYDYYLRGRSYMYSMARRDYEHAIRMFEQAIALDSKYALAYAGLADAYSHMYRYVEATPDNVEKANRASEQAVVLDRDSAEAHASRGMALFISERYDEAEREFETAIARNPNLFEAWYYYGLATSSQGRVERAAELYTKASEVNPADFQVPMFLAMAYATLGRKQDEMRVRLGALGTLERHLKLNPHDTRAIYFARAEPLPDRRTRQGDRHGGAGHAAGHERTGRALQRRLFLHRPGRNGPRHRPARTGGRPGLGRSGVDGKRQRPGSVACRSTLPGPAGAHSLSRSASQHSIRSESTPCRSARPERRRPAAMARPATECDHTRPSRWLGRADIRRIP